MKELQQYKGKRILNRVYTSCWVCVTVFFPWILQPCRRHHLQHIGHKDQIKAMYERINYCYYLDYRLSPMVVQTDVAAGSLIVEQTTKCYQSRGFPLHPRGSLEDSSSSPGSTSLPNISQS